MTATTATKRCSFEISLYEKQQSASSAAVLQNSCLLLAICHQLPLLHPSEGAGNAFDCHTATIATQQRVAGFHSNNHQQKQQLPATAANV